MPTQLTKIVKRKTPATVFDRGRKHIILSLEPSAFVGVRLAGTRRRYLVDAESIYSIAVKMHNQEIEKRAKQIAKSDGVRIGTARAKARKELEGMLKS
jgi:hypothetical protein